MAKIFYRLQRGKKIEGHSAHHAQWAEGPLWSVPDCRVDEARAWIEKEFPSEGRCRYCGADRIRIPTNYRFPSMTCPHWPPHERYDVLIEYCRLHDGVDAAEQPDDLIRLMREWDLLFEVDDALEISPELRGMFVLEISGKMIGRIEDGVVVGNPQVRRAVPADQWVREWAKRKGIRIQ